MKAPKNITRYTYNYTSFQGWRLAICRRGKQFTRYFSDRVYGGEQAALLAASHLRQSILECMGEGREEPETVFARFREAGPSARFPRGLKPRHRPLP